MDNLRLDPRLVVLEAETVSAGDALRMAGELFYRWEYAGEGYGQALIKREERYPTGLAGRRFGIAIPHADGACVRESAASVIVPRKPVTFGLMGGRGETVECHIIFPFAVRNAGLQPATLRKLMGLLRDEDRLARIWSARDQETVIGELRELKL